MFTSHVLHENQKITLSWSNKKNLMHWWNQQSHDYAKNEDEFADKFYIGNQWLWNMRSQFLHHLEKKPARILDIGSGIATYDLFLSKLYPEYQFYLLDKSQSQVPSSVVTEIKRQYRNKEIFQKNFYFYNSWEPTIDAIINSDIDISRFKFVNPDHRFTEKVDVIMSLASWLWHYPSSQYEKYIDDILVPGGLMMVDRRSYPGNIELEDFTTKHRLTLLNETPINLDDRNLGSVLILKKSK